MKTQNDGGSAFPLDPQMLDPHSTQEQIKSAQGMSLRDWFAGMAITNSLQHAYVDPQEYSAQEVAEWSYKLADAMLSARKQKEDA